MVQWTFECLTPSHPKGPPDSAGWSLSQLIARDSGPTAAWVRSVWRLRILRVVAESAQKGGNHVPSFSPRHPVCAAAFLCHLWLNAVAMLSSSSHWALLIFPSSLEQPLCVASITPLSWFHSALLGTLSQLHSLASPPPGSTLRPFLCPHHSLSHLIWLHGLKSKQMMTQDLNLWLEHLSDLQNHIYNCPYDISIRCPTGTSNITGPRLKFHLALFPSPPNLSPCSSVS